MKPSNLDNATLYLLNDLELDYSITFEQKEIEYAEVFQVNKTATIYYNPKIIDTESIAHELLHIWLNRFNYSIGNHIFSSTRNDNKLNKIIDKRLCEHITNCCDHFKMYPKYIEMGYSPSKFLIRGLEPKASLNDITKIKLKTLWCHSAFQINNFIGHLISILADHVENNYSLHHKILKCKDKELYGIVAAYWYKWEKFDIKSIDAVFNSDYELTNCLMKELSIWAENKIIS